MLADTLTYETNYELCRTSESIAWFQFLTTVKCENYAVTNFCYHRLIDYESYFPIRLNNIEFIGKIINQKKFFNLLK